MSTVRDRLRAAIPAAMKQRDLALVAALRATLAALDNAEAPPAEDHGSPALESTPVGVGVREAARQELTEAEEERLVRAEIDERRTAAQIYEQAGQPERAQRLREQAHALALVAGL